MRLWWYRPVHRTQEWPNAPLRPLTSVPGLGETSQRATDFISDADAEPCPARVLAVTDDSADRSVWKPFASEGPHGHRDRMHDRLLERGADGLADYELVEMLLFFAQAKGDTKPVAKRLINRFGSYSSVLCATPKDLQKVQGVDRHSIAAIKLAHAGAVRLARAQLLNRTILGNWDRLIDYLMAAMARERIEQFRILFLDAKNELIADEVHGRGTINHTPVYPREVARRALELYAAALIFVHNHPSGDPTPSMADIEMTEQMQRVLQSLGISLHDHIIVGDGRWTSLKKEGFIS